VDAFDARIRQRALEKRAAIPSRLYEMASSGDLPKSRVGLALEEVALDRTQKAVDEGVISPNQARSFYRMQMLSLGRHQPELEQATEVPTMRLGEQAPVTPGELAWAGGMSVGVPWLGSRMPGVSSLFGGPISTGEAAKWTVSPKFIGFSVLGDVLGSGLGAFSQPGYQKGEQGYMSAVGSAFKEHMRGVGQASREARDRYGLFGVPLQALHGIWNPLASTGYMLKNVKDTVFDKAGSAALRAQHAVEKALKEA